MTERYGALFDLDGVLVDTEGSYSHFWGEMGRRYRPDIPGFDMVVKGTTLPDILRRYFSNPDVSEPICAELEKFEARMTYPLFDGVMAFLADLRAHGIPAAIVTSSGADKMKRIFDGNPEFASFFDALVTSADVSRSKPDPECYLTGARKLGMEIGDCYVFEDSINGLASGMASGATVIGLSTTLPAAELRGRAHLLIPSLSGFTVDRMLAVTR